MRIHAKTQSKLIRILSSALLQSSLSDEELREISNALAEDPHLLRQIAWVVKAYVDEVAQLRLPSEVFNVHHPNSLIDELVSEIKRRRLSKHQLLNTISTLVPDLAKTVHLERTTASEIVSTFMSQANESAKAQFINWLRLPPNTDAYLNGILKQNERDRDARK